MTIPAKITLLFLFFLSACDSQNTEQAWISDDKKKSVTNQVNGPSITLADIDPDSPSNRMLKLRPLADYIAQKLGWDNARVKIVIASSVDEISAMVKDGKVDLFLDSSYPTVLVQKASGATIILDSRINGQRSYHTLLVALADGEITQLADLENREIVLQERYSTSGYLLPAALLSSRGFRLAEIPRHSAQTPDGHIGYFYSGDDENTLLMIRKGIIAAGALSSSDFEDLPTEVKQELRILATSKSVPRKMATLRSGFDKQLGEKLIAILLSINDVDRKKMLENEGWEWKFATLDKESYSGIATINEMINELNNSTNRTARKQQRL